ncbi:MAG: hypothetical protein ABH969_00500 [Pseudomonadota bacterium]
MNKNILLTLAMVVMIGFAFYPIQSMAMMGSGSGMGGGMMGGFGSGMMGGGNSGMGPGGGQGMGPESGQGMGPGMNFPGDGRQYGPQYGPQIRQPQKPLDKNDARGMAENYLKSTKNPNLHLGKIKDNGDAFEASILTRDNSLADKMLIDKNTGSMRSIY